MEPNSIASEGKGQASCRLATDEQGTDVLATDE